jgi:hypothetical protein
MMMKIDVSRMKIVTKLTAADCKSFNEEHESVSTPTQGVDYKTRGTPLQLQQSGVEGAAPSIQAIETAAA